MNAVLSYIKYQLKYIWLEKLLCLYQKLLSNVHRNKF
jgi:hypothetical protein